MGRRLNRGQGWAALVLALAFAAVGARGGTNLVEIPQHLVDLLCLPAVGSLVDRNIKLHLIAVKQLVDRNLPSRVSMQGHRSWTHVCKPGDLIGYRWCAICMV